MLTMDFIGMGHAGQIAQPSLPHRKILTHAQWHVTTLLPVKASNIPLTQMSSLLKNTANC